MNRSIWVIFLKELLEVRRDRKTLFVTFLIPLLAFPIFITVLVRYSEYLVQQKALRTIRLAASPQTRDDYLRFSFEAYKQSTISYAIQSPNSPLGLVLKSVGFPPPDGTSPNALQASARQQALEMARTIQLLGHKFLKSRTSETRIPEVFVEQITHYYENVIQGLGLINFVDPANLAEPPATFTMDKIPPEIRPLPDSRKIAWSILRRKIQGYLALPPNLDRLPAEDASRAEIVLVYDSTISLSAEAQERLRHVVDAWRDRFVGMRLARHDLSPAFVQPVDLKKEMNLASKSQQIMAMIAGMVPYIIIIFAFIGGMATATDLGAGEKERGTLETLLLTPASRTELALGKFYVIMLASLTAGLLSIVSLGLTLRFAIPSGFMQLMDLEVDPTHIAMMATLALPAAATFASILLALSILARSAKEAQTYMTPISFVLLIPGMAAMMPDLEPSITLACVPLVNVALLMREFMKGEAWWTCYCITMASSLVVAGVCVGLAVWLFRREEVLFRS